MCREQKTLLITNDDGYNSKGIQLLFNILKNDYHIVIVAPESEKSGVGHSFTYHHPIIYEKISDGYADNIYSVNGSPADCVKFAVSHLLSAFPDIIVAGLNIGENSGISSFYSGTVAAAREAAFWKIWSFAFSLCEEAERYSDQYVRTIPTLIQKIINVKKGFSENIFYNINFPPCHPEKVKGIKITRQSMAFFNDKYEKIELEYEKYSKFGYKIYGEKVGIESSDEYDSRALLDGWITITPLSFDSTAYAEMIEIKKVEKIFSFKGIDDVRN